MLVDSHAHLYFDDYKNDLEEVLARARDAGVGTIICPGTDLDTSRKSVELAERHDMIYAAVGIHPHDASKASANVLEEIEKLSTHPRVVAIGEIGLDYHYNFSPPEVQREVFSAQIAIASRRGLPIIIHSREAEDDTLRIVESATKEYPDWRSNLRKEYDRLPVPKGVFHCFPGNSSMAWKVIGWGFYVSLPGPVTFGNKPARPNLMVDVATNVSAEHILIETDSPYLSPAPHRGKRNEPAYVRLVAEKIAECQGLSVRDIARASNYGAYRLFGVGQHSEPVIAYELRDSLYLNITLRCNADCVFCDRKGEAVIKGHNLRIEKEPEIHEIIEAIGDPKRYREIVFCGFGEPTIRMDVIREVGRWVKEQGGSVRLNTDGHGSIINHRNIAPELREVVDAVSISLNSIDPEQYGRLMRIDGRTMFPAMVDFSKECVRAGLDVTMTIVDLNEVDEGKARQFVEKEIGAKFRTRPYF